MAQPIYFLREFAIWYKNKHHQVRGAKADYSVELNLEKQCPTLGIKFQDQYVFLTETWPANIGGNNVYESLLNDGALSLVKLMPPDTEEQKQRNKYAKETKVIE